MAHVRELTRLTAGMPIIFAGNRVIEVPEEIAARFSPGDSVLVVEATEKLLHIPHEETERAREAVSAAIEAFGAMSEVAGSSVDAFYRAFAGRLRSEATWCRIAAANAEDVARAKERGRQSRRPWK